MKISFRSGSDYPTKRAKLVRSCVLITIISYLSCTSTAIALTGHVVLQGGGDEEFCDQIESSLTTVINAIDRQDYELVEPMCTPEGWNELFELATSLTLHNARPVHETRLLTVPDGYEVRNIKVQVDLTSMRGTKANPYQYMVFSLTRDGLISGVRFSLENHHDEYLLEQAEQLNDFAVIQQIRQFIEIYRTAYNLKDIEYIERVFSDDALIIVGRVVRTDSDGQRQSDYFRSSEEFDNESIAFIRRSKTEYIDALSRAFANNEYVHVGFDSVAVVRHKKDETLYGVTLRQEWRSTSYSDTGYVFFMLEFSDEVNPLIHVRSWQPKKFPDGTTISLYDFQLIR